MNAYDKNLQCIMKFECLKIVLRFLNWQKIDIKPISRLKNCTLKLINKIKIYQLVYSVFLYT